tara:strand:+ start:315 stop:695 length:381 start_codon:yes stop_codon:yes gene_type:complete
MAGSWFAFGLCFFRRRADDFFCALNVSIMSKAKGTIEIKQLLDLDDPLSKMILTLAIVTMALRLVSNPLDDVLIGLLLSDIVNFLFILYTLSCYRNGGCNIYAMVAALFVILLLIMRIMVVVNAIV